MNSSKNILKLFTRKTILISIFILILNYILLGVWVYRENFVLSESIIANTSEGLKHEENSYILDEETMKVLKQHNIWAMLIGDHGKVLWSQDLPADIPMSYSLKEVALFTRYYLKDYPVYVWEHSDGLVVLGYPKDSYGKYNFSFSISWVKALPFRIITLLIFNIFLALLLSVAMGSRLMKSIKVLIDGLQFLANDKPVNLEERGVLYEVASSVNNTSNLLQEKNKKLKERDKARLNWISGISHDIRTPLSMILGYSSELEENENLPVKEREDAGIIKNQGIKLRDLVNDLNLVSMLEYEMQPLNNKKLRPASLVRELASDFLNNGLDEKYKIELQINSEAMIILGDERLLKRSITNLIQNSITHNPKGCAIKVLIESHRETCTINVEDNGIGVSQKRLESLLEPIYETHSNEKIEESHGLGLKIVKRIVMAHKGKFLISSNEGKGFVATIQLPLLK